MLKRGEALAGNVICGVACRPARTREPRCLYSPWLGTYCSKGMTPAWTIATAKSHQFCTQRPILSLEVQAAHLATRVPGRFRAIAAF